MKLNLKIIMIPFFFSCASDNDISILPPTIIPPGNYVESDVIPIKSDNVTYTDLTKSYEKTSGGSLYNAGFVADKMILANTGGVIFQSGSVGANKIMALSHDNADWNFNSMDFAILLGNGGATHVYENNTTPLIQVGSSQDYWFKIEVNQDSQNPLIGNVSYYRSLDGIDWGLPLYTSTSSAKYPLLITASLYADGNRLKNCKVYGTNLVDTIIPKFFVKTFLTDNNYNAFGKSFSFYNSNGNVPIDEVHHYTRTGVGGHIGVYAYITKNVYHISTDTWDAPINVLDEGTNYDLRDPCGGYIGGTLFIFMQKNTTNLVEQKFGYYTSTDNGTTFSAFNEIIGYDESRAFPFGDLQKSDVPGTFFIYFTDFNYPSTNIYNNYILKTTDYGITWQVIKIHSSIVNPTFFITEGTLTHVGGSSYILLLRNKEGSMKQINSSDNWNTWTTITDTNIGGTDSLSSFPTMCSTYYDEVNQKFYVIYQDRTIGKLQGLIADKTQAFNGPTNYPPPSFSYFNRYGIHNGIGYPSMVKIGSSPTLFHLVFADESTPERSNAFCDERYALLDSNLN